MDLPSSPSQECVEILAAKDPCPGPAAASSWTNAPVSEGVTKRRGGELTVARRDRRCHEWRPRVVRHTAVHARHPSRSKPRCDPEARLSRVSDPVLMGCPT